MSDRIPGHLPGCSGDGHLTCTRMADPAVSEWHAALGQSTSAQLRETQKALFASQQDLTAMQAERDKATRLLEYALHLRMRGERAPGGNETWAQFDQEVELFLRGLPVRPTPHLDAVKRDRDGLAALNAELTAEVLQVRADNVKHVEREQQLRRMLTDAQQDLKAAGDDADKQGAEYDRQIHKLRQELAGVEHDLEHTRFKRDRARSWQVARNDDTGTCFMCGFPIVRGQAVEPQPGTTKGSYAHCFCPDPTPTKEN